jgi:hypothetical protein
VWFGPYNKFNWRFELYEKNHDKSTRNKKIHLHVIFENIIQFDGFFIQISVPIGHGSEGKFSFFNLARISTSMRRDHEFHVKKWGIHQELHCTWYFLLVLHKLLLVPT